MEIIIGILAGLIVLVVILWIGLKIKPGTFAPLPVQDSELNTMTLPEELPAPVDRFYRTVFGDRVPVIESAVISGRAKMRMFGITLPGRFRFIHDAADEDKTLWINEALEWRDINGQLTMAVGGITWFDDGVPWAVFSVDEVVYNADVGEYVQKRGP